ncbi:protein CURLY FLAG LEAF 1-like [Musa acuminata AAA Group]|uniref:protein CURLY FLAG LEAF 1-like n=1 Tax=Musa acuminata AAA Group TaxID=214697 RepID=UPI0031D05F6F
MMVVDVSSEARMLRGYEEGDRRRELVTRDLLGGNGAVLGSTVVDLELKVPAGWERRLDLSSGRTYLLKRNPDPAPRRYHELNLKLPPPSSAAHFLEMEAAAPPSRNQSVCTLEQVKYALERAGCEERSPAARRPRGSPAPHSSSITTSSSNKRMMMAEREEGASPPGTMAVAGCPECLLYVLVSVVAPRCPRCAAHVPVHSEPKKRPKFDLNTITQNNDEDVDLN